MRNKKAFDLPFSWLFAIIAGSVILILAIYGVSKLIGSMKYEQYTEGAKKLSILLNPMEAGLASGKSASIKFRTETRTFYDCSITGKNIFGRNLIRFSEKSGIGEKWAEPGGDIAVYNMYIFANKTEEGKDLWLFSKPFFMGFKVADLIFISSRTYCFKDTPNPIKEEVEMLGIKNIKLENCSEEDVEVCFGKSGCEISVSGNSEYSSGRVVKNGKSMYYSGSLIFGAIFSTPESYECNVKRLMIKTVQLSHIYKDKIGFVEKRGCNSNIEPDLNLMINLGNSFSGSEQLAEAEQIAKSMNGKNNNNVYCKIYEVQE